MGQLNLIDVTLLLAAAQGFFLTVYLLHRHRKPIPNRFLIVLIFSYSVILTEMVLEEAGFWDTFPFLVPFVLGIVFVLVPVHYYYALHLTRPARRLRLTDLLHLLPFVTLELSQGIGLLFGNDPTREMFVPSNGGIALFNFIVMSYGLTYMVMTLIRLKHHASTSADFLSNLERVHFRWLKNLTWLTITILLTFSIENLLLLKGIVLSDNFNLTSLLNAIFVYAIGYQVLSHPEVLVIPEREIRGGGEGGVASNVEPNVDRVEIRSNDSPKYQKSGLSEERAEEIRQRLLALMIEAGAYRDPDLTLNDLANRLDVSPHNLSEVINTRLGLNFFDFVNSYRIDEVKKDILDPSKHHLKMLALAFEAGFRSKSSFNLLFKKHVGMTPSEFRAKQANPK